VGLPGEAPDATARRELLEEVGIDLEGRLSGVYFEPGHDFGPMLHFVFTASLPPGAAPTPSSDEIGALDWRRPDDLPAPISDFTERRIRDALGGSPADMHAVGQRRWREG
jgi:8-oxo-dGTP pyrophosphatase MutT (NUDIX family)